ncbi:MAG: universal stress protein, partial [Flavobacteriales bacterium]
MNDILCPTDLSETSLKGVHYADLLAERSGGTVSLLHVMGKKDLTEEGRSKAKSGMEQQRARITRSPAVIHFREGDFISEIADECKKGHRLMVCATHGLRGLRQSLFGADILKLVRHVEVPSLVVQAKSPEQNDFAVIVMPVAGHPDIEHLLNGVALLAKTFGSTVHIYQLVRPGESPSHELLTNKSRMVEWLKK